MPGSANAALIKGLATKARLSEEDRSALAALPIDELHVQRGQDVLREGDRPSRSALLISGLTCSYKTLASGRRQITAFYHAGDVPDLQSLHLDVADNSILALVDSHIGYIRHRDLEDISAKYPTVSKALWRATLVDAAIYREWTTNLGQRDAMSRMAHLFCETLVKQQVIGLASGDSCMFPVTQAELADALGLSVVHVNRSLMELRASGTISFERAELIVHDLGALEKQGGFDRSYLHLRMDDHAPHKLK
ncbi:Crp/Fnr family transcriptional regulator [Tianweitania sp.]|uniref:Crp/Fnr family transcriptional regulator n=1 Tax=Tianweitania sp. TaxID=2021634 RepID=UPI00289EEEC9|nr:Crp/Fnr family transcriptional regulator [Tianweitania sp.]